MSTTHSSAEVPQSVLFCVSAGSAVTVLHERIWEASSCKTPDHWPVHTLNAVSLSVCHLYSVSFSVLLLSVCSSLQYVCLPVSLPLTAYGRCGLSLKPCPWMCQWLRPPAQQSSVFTRCLPWPRPAPAVTSDHFPTMPGNTRVHSVTQNLEVSGNFKRPAKIMDTSILSLRSLLKICSLLV